ncbi:hypothetical protein BK130_13795 [Viridibacillus sp. FSL H8-0123]|nr:hypothetical protein BK130_13795 [Viridibacillus sp. FSL H8-0123]OMC89103.1 hypothetical protein BK128_04005 [Viridibacillus sp. FSL H7-0596]OMC89834.1 hypothetical protein BK137_15670 [Viridibacillus arenosi]
MRLLFFLTFYGLIVISSTHMILYLNYRALGYTWTAVFMFILHTVDFKIFIGSSIGLVIVYFSQGPSRLPFS